MVGTNDAACDVGRETTARGGVARSRPLRSADDDVDDWHRGVVTRALGTNTKRRRRRLCERVTVDRSDYGCGDRRWWVRARARERCTYNSGEDYGYRRRHRQVDTSYDCNSRTPIIRRPSRPARVLRVTWLFGRNRRRLCAQGAVTRPKREPCRCPRRSVRAIRVRTLAARNRPPAPAVRNVYTSSCRKRNWFASLSRYQDAGRRWTPSRTFARPSGVRQ